jgi:hypothetical protein
MCEVTVSPVAVQDDAPKAAAAAAAAAAGAEGEEKRVDEGADADSTDDAPDGGGADGGQKTGEAAPPRMVTSKPSKQVRVLRAVSWRQEEPALVDPARGAHTQTHTQTDTHLHVTLTPHASPDHHHIATTLFLLLRSCFPSTTWRPPNSTSPTCFTTRPASCSARAFARCVRVLCLLHAFVLALACAAVA